MASYKKNMKKKNYSLEKVSQGEMNSLQKKEYVKYKKLLEEMKCTCKSIGYKFIADKYNHCLCHISYTTIVCKSRICPYCSKKNSQKWMAIFNKNINKFYEENKKNVFFSLALTVKNCPIEDVKGEVEKMSKGFEKLLTRKTFQSLQNPEINPSKTDCSKKRFQGYVQGYVRKLEVDYSGPEEAHPHFHILLCLKPCMLGKNYICRNVLSLMWQEVMGLDYEPQVNMKRLKVKEQILQELHYFAKPLKIEENFRRYGKPFMVWLCKYEKQMERKRDISFSKIFQELKKSAPYENQSLQKTPPYFWNRDLEDYVDYYSPRSTLPRAS